MRLDELYQLGRRLQAVSQAAMSDREVDVSPAELLVLRHLLTDGSATITEIASRSGFVHSRVSTAVASLRDRGWVATSADEHDRRRTIVTATDRVRAGAVKARARRAEPVLSALLDQLPVKRRDEVIAAIHELNDALAARSDAPLP